MRDDQKRKSVILKGGSDQTILETDHDVDVFEAIGHIMSQFTAPHIRRKIAQGNKVRVAGNGGWSCVQDIGLDPDNLDITLTDW